MIGEQLPWTYHALVGAEFMMVGMATKKQQLHNKKEKNGSSCRKLFTGKSPRLTAKCSKGHGCLSPCQVFMW